jgi:predicted Zn-dependent peptidase
LETSDAQAYFFGNQELLKGEIDPIEKIFDEIDKVREEDVLTVSKDIFRPENLNLAVVGSINQDELKNMIKR